MTPLLTFQTLYSKSGMGVKRWGGGGATCRRKKVQGKKINKGRMSIRGYSKSMSRNPGRDKGKGD